MKQKRSELFLRQLAIYYIHFPSINQTLLYLKCNLRTPKCSSYATESSELYIQITMPMVEKRDRGRSRDSGNDSMQEISKMCLEALPVDDGWSGFIVFLFRNPHLLEGRQRRKNRSTNPYGVFPLRWCDNLDFHGGWC